MKKNGFFTFCFAFIPGAGHMYHDYMKRGISLMLLFALSIVLYSSTGWALFGILIPILWCATFFDTFHVAHRDEAARAANPDDWLWVDLGEVGQVKFTPNKNRVLGIAFVVAGIWLLFERLPRMLQDLGVSMNWPVLNFIRNNVPGLAVAALLIWLGAWFIRGPKKEEQPVYRTVQGAAQDAGSKAE